MLTFEMEMPVGRLTFPCCGDCCRLKPGAAGPAAEERMDCTLEILRGDEEEEEEEALGGILRCCG